MKRKNIFAITLFGLFGLFLMQGCTKEDNTTFTIKQAFTQPAATSPTVRADGTVLFTGTTVDLTWESTNPGGDPVSWTVYFGTGKAPALFKSGVTTNTIAVPVVDGQTYYWKVQVSDSRGITTTSVVNKFIAVNGTNPQINVGLTTSTNVKSIIGVDLAADKVVDLRMFIVKKSDMSVIKTINAGKSSEVFNDFSTLPDGEYLIGVDIASTLNAGDLNQVVDLSLALKFDQLGAVNETLEFANVMTNANACSLYRTYLASVKKVGAVYTIAKEVSYLSPSILTWKGTDDAYASEITSSESCTAKTMHGVAFGWMLDYWGEIITSGGTLTYTISGNTITIPLQKYCKTTYKGAAQPEYSIQGTGTIDTSGAFPVYTIKYDLQQSGSTILTKANGVPAGFLEAIITSNPAGL